MRRDTRIAAAVLPLLPVAVLAAVLLVTWMLAHGASPSWRLPFRLLCHGIPERCLVAFGTKMPICARCFGIYVGLFCGLIAFRAFLALRPRIIGWIALAGALPMALDGVTQALHFRSSTNPLRLVTGFVAAFLFGVWVLNEIEHVSDIPDQTP